MTKKLNCILLIDDDGPTNFIHERLIRIADCAEKIVTRQSGMEALEYLRSQEDGEDPKPDLVFLDINMPRMNGWEFLLEYGKLEEAQKAKAIVVMLTTSLNPDDEERALEIKDVKGFYRKPLIMETLNKILSDYFPEGLYAQ